MWGWPCLLGWFLEAMKATFFFVPGPSRTLKFFPGPGGSRERAFDPVSRDRTGFGAEIRFEVLSRLGYQSCFRGLRFRKPGRNPLEGV